MDVIKLLKKNKIVQTTTDELCVQCKKNGRVHCPHKTLIYLKSQPIFDKTEFFGPSPPNVFVPQKNYPNIFPQPILLLDEKISANPKDWYGFDIKKIIYISSMQIRGILNNTNKIIENTSQIIMSTNQVDIEIKCKKKPLLKVDFNSIHYPIGPSAPIESLNIATNPKIPKKVDQILEENIKTTDAVFELIDYGFDEFYLTKLLSCGILGKKRNKKFVPTRWSITAIDSIIANYYIKILKEFDENQEILLYFNTYLANRFFIILLPGKWSFENIEAWCGSKINFAISIEDEGYNGRTTYAFKQGGGYYATKLAVCEQLVKKIKKQAKIIVIREIMPEYDLPVGVWEIRENVRHAFEKEPKKFDSLDNLYLYLKKVLFLDLNEYLKTSIFLKQRKLNDFF